MEVLKTTIPGLLILSPKKFEDARGYFCETFNAKTFENEVGQKINFVQDNESLSQGKYTLRGLHFQTPPYAQSKLVRVLSGAVFDVAVDLREGSKTYGQWEGVELSYENGRQLFVPKGFAHGFCTLEKNTRVAYKVDAFYDKAHDGGVRFNDPSLGVKWPTQTPVLSDKDLTLPFLSELNKTSL